MLLTRFSDVFQGYLKLLPAARSPQDGREYTLLVKLKGAESGRSYQVRWVPKDQSTFEAQQLRKAAS